MTAQRQAKAAPNPLERLREYGQAVWLDFLSRRFLAERGLKKQEHTFGEKMLSAMRFGFGGHIEGKEPIDPQSKPKEPQGRSATPHAE
jgi:6-phosphogluconate dehydrogenase